MLRVVPDLKKAVLLKISFSKLLFIPPHFSILQCILHSVLLSHLLNANKLHISWSLICIAFDGSGSE